jgi:hypothetical protein
MNRDHRSSSNDPTAERAADQSTQTAAGLSSATGPDANEGHRETRDETARAALDTPRRYDQPIEDDDDPVMPGDETTANTKI